jgi:carbamoyltransferase
MGYILGINSVYHESAACLLKDGLPVAFVEEERLSRRKHAKEARVDNPDELPWLAIDYCLHEAGITFAEVTAIGYSFNPPKRLRNRGLGEPVISGDWGSEAGEDLFQQRLSLIPAAISQRAGFDMRDRFHWLDHHLCHAASAYLASPFSEAAILAIDGIGEFATAWLGHGEQTRMTSISEIEYPHSLGFLWEKLSVYLGFSPYDASKVMGLAAYGDPQVFAAGIDTLIRCVDGGRFEVASEILRFRSGDFQLLEELLGPRRKSGEPLGAHHAHIASALQTATDRVVLHLAAHLRAQTGSRHLCLAGGVALNCITNRLLQDSGLFDSLYIQPATHDAGTALGAALLLEHQIPHGAGRYVQEHAYLGPAYNEREITEALERHGLSYRRTRDPAGEAASLIASGAIVAWFQGRLEAGPRALGNRSLLADPRRREMRQTLNEKVKHREDFRPFAPAVLAEKAEDWFLGAGQSQSSDYMLFAYAARPERAAQIPAVVHADGTCRVQTVRAKTNPLFHRLLVEFNRLTGVPLVLNTSFNDSEPIVCSPDDAVRTFISTRIDILIIGDFIVDRRAGL